MTRFYPLRYNYSSPSLRYKDRIRSFPEDMGRTLKRWKAWQEFDSGSVINHGYVMAADAGMALVHAQDKWPDVNRVEES